MYQEIDGTIYIGIRPSDNKTYKKKHLKLQLIGNKINKSIKYIVIATLLGK